jgi:hypothetical protein
MIIVVILMLVAIFSTKPPSKAVFSYDQSKCPDYWTLQKTPLPILNTYDGAERAQLAYRCVRDPNLPSNTLKNFTATADTDLDMLLKVTKRPYQTEYTPPATGKQATGNLNCDVVYPDFMNFQDMQYKNNNELSPNRLRCAYASKCGMSWSSVCPSKK